MKTTLLLLFCCLVLPLSVAMAQSGPPMRGPSGSGKEGEITSRPICSWLTNRSDQTIMGTITTASQRLPDGSEAQHRDNFRLAAGERQKICAAGPFFEGQRLELVLRTLMPLFSCKTKIDREIFLDAKVQPGGFRKLSATCY